jgi:hypothetical protein
VAVYESKKCSSLLPQTVLYNIKSVIRFLHVLFINIFWLFSRGKTALFENKGSYKVMLVYKYSQQRTFTIKLFTIVIYTVKITHPAMINKEYTAKSY